MARPTAIVVPEALDRPRTAKLHDETAVRFRSDESLFQALYGDFLAVRYGKRHSPNVICEGPSSSPAGRCCPLSPRKIPEAARRLGAKLLH